MSSNSEVGHARNIANLQDLILFCQGYGTTYNPSKANLQITALQNLLLTAQTNLANVSTTNTAFYNAVNARAMAFEALPKFCTRLVNALQATDASKKTIEDARGFQKKVSGAPSSAAAQIAPPNASNNPPITLKKISTSQRSYDYQVEHFANLINVLATEPSYNPNETELQTATLNAQLTTLKNLNTAVANAYTTVSNARIARNKSLYAPDTGLCEVAADVKNYVISIYGKSSQEFKQISGIKFSKIKT